MVSAEVPVGTGTGPGEIGDPARLAAIARLGLHGHLGDPHLDAIVATVAAACDVPLAVINIVTPDLQTYPAEVGVEACSTEVPDEVSFCAEVVRTGRGLTVADALADSVYGTNPLVAAGVIGAYAGEPLRYHGHVIGALSIFDSAPRVFTTQELDVLRAQARLAMGAVRLHALQARDELTGLSNRLGLLATAERAMRDATDGQLVALLVLDVVGMGQLNASLGSAGGDLVLRTIGDRLQAAGRATDSVARIGGDEFAVLLDQVSSVEDGRGRAASICAAVKGHLLVQGVPVALDVRCGLTTADAANADALLAAAERAAADEPTPERVRRSPLPLADVVELARAIDGGQLALYYHPIVDLSTDHVTGVEALIRWQHPQRGLLLPQDFIPLAEESGLIVRLGDWVLRTGAAQAADWARRGRQLDVAINLSPLQMAAPGFADHCRAVLASVQSPVNRIVLEVTESALLDQPDAARSLNQLRSQGVRLALDDFGTGYCSFSYLRRFPIDMIKIDRSFVAGLGVHPDDEAIVASVVGLARSTGKSIVAEGVETLAQLEHLRALGVDAAQGFLWTRPLPAAVLDMWIEAAAGAGLRAPVPESPSAVAEDDETDRADEIVIRRMHTEGASLHTIAAALNAGGSRASTGRRWHMRSVAGVIAPPLPVRRHVSKPLSTQPGPVAPAVVSG